MTPKMITYAVPPYRDDDKPVQREFLPITSLKEAALVVHKDEIRPALIIGGDMAIVLTWRQTRELAELLREWSRLPISWGTGAAPDKPCIGSKEL